MPFSAPAVQDSATWVLPRTAVGALVWPGTPVATIGFDSANGPVPKSFSPRTANVYVRPGTSPVTTRRTVPAASGMVVVADPGDLTWSSKPLVAAGREVQVTVAVPRVAVVLPATASRLAGAGGGATETLVSWVQAPAASLVA